MVLKYILRSAVLLLIAPTTFANGPFPPTEIDGMGDHLEYSTFYTLEKSCNFSYPYRTIDGSCNNLDNPLLGRSFTPFKRFLDPDYSYFPFPTNSVPDSRDLSKTLFGNNTQTSTEQQINDFFVVAAQMILHDTALAQRNNASIQCCPLPANTTECMPNLFRDSPNLNTHNPACHNFVRNLGVGSLSGMYGPRQQLNVVTHYLDGSTIYGSTQEELNSLREPNSAKMRVTNVGNNALLPTMGKAVSPNNCPFFRGGDRRASAVITITTHHTFWIREHNYIVDGLLKLRNDWDNETLFQEARKIVIAEFQHIAYEEILPLLLGEDNMQYFQLYSTFQYNYLSNVDGSTANEYTTAAFRQAHLMLDDVILFDQNGRDTSRRNTDGICNSGINSLSCEFSLMMNLSEALRSPDRLYSCQSSMASLVMGTIKKHSQLSNDMRVAKTIKNMGNGLDLIAIDIERNRDHGTPSYTAWRNYCGLSAFTFSYNSNTHRSNILTALQTMYITEDDVDLYVGASLENKLEDAVLGPTFACIIAQQMYDTKYGDRFWYQNENQFQYEQLEEIKRQKMSMILKRNINLSRVPVNPFVVPTPSTTYQSDDADFNFQAWR